LYKITVRDRLLLLGTVILSAYLIIASLEGLAPLSIWIFTIGFGILLVACLLLIILGFEGLESQAVVTVSTAIPLCTSLGLISVHFPSLFIPYLIFCIIGFGITGVTRFTLPGQTSTLVLALVHGVAGLMILYIPFRVVVAGTNPPGYLLVSLGGALIGLGGLLLAFMRAGKPILSQDVLYKLLPGILLLMSAAFVGGFYFN
jgi:hypothetical protein